MEIVVPEVSQQPPSLPPPPMLLLLECCFLESLECSSVLSQVPMHLLMAWEEESCSLILREGLQRIGWWQKCFQK